jgi:hypothetical protein
MIAQIVCSFHELSAGDLGYHTFLYPTEKEIRNLFILLIGNIKPFLFPQQYTSPAFLI